MTIQTRIPQAEINGARGALVKFVADDVELAESLSIAMLTVLETLGPTERAVFVLREVFDVPYDEIADAVGKTRLRLGRSHTGRRARSRHAAPECASSDPSSRKW